MARGRPLKTTESKTDLTLLNPVLNSRSLHEVKDEVIKLQTRINKFNSSCWCYLCGTHKDESHFYVSTDPNVKSGYAPVCKECARKIAMRVTDDGVEREPTKESVQLALRYLDKPFLNSVWEASIQESQNLTLARVKTNVWTAYAKNIAMINYSGMTYADSDMFKNRFLRDDDTDEQKMVAEHIGMDAYDAYLKNKSDVIRLLDYDPFEEEPVKDQPFLYSQLLGMLDASADVNEDMMRVSSAIQIVRAFLQSAKIDDAIAKLMGNIESVQNNSATIKSLQDSKQKLTSMITNLAAESCLSLKNSKTKTKGEDTFSGRLRKLREINLRDADINGYDLQTCKGMQQVADISMEAIIKGLRFSEDEMSDIVATQRKMIGKMDLETKAYKEAVRILLKENLDLRDSLLAKGIQKNELINLDELVRTYITNPQNEVVPDE